MVRWLRWHCPQDTGFEIRTLAVWGRARYLSVTEAPHNTNFHTWMGNKHFCFFQTAETGNRTPNSGVKGSGANHYPRAPAQMTYRWHTGDIQMTYRWHTYDIQMTYEWYTDDTHVIQMTYRWHTDDIQMTYRWHADDIRMTYRWYTDVIQMTYRWHTDDIQMTYRWHTDDIQMSYRWHTDDIQMTYVWHTDDIQMIYTQQQGSFLPFCHLHLMPCRRWEAIRRFLYSFTFRHNSSPVTIALCGLADISITDRSQTIRLSERGRCASITNTEYWAAGGVMLGKRRRRWTNITPPAVQYLVFPRIYINHHSACGR